MPSTLRSTLLLACTAAALAGCMTVGPNFKAPSPPPAQSYAMAGDEPAAEAAIGDRLAGDWWALFRSPDVDHTIRAAVAGNHGLEAARQSLLEARDAIDAQAPAATLVAGGAIEEQRANLAAFGFSRFALPGGG